MISYQPINLKPGTIDLKNHGDFSKGHHQAHHHDHEDETHTDESIRSEGHDINVFKEKIVKQEKEKLKINKIKKTKLILLLTLTHFLVYLLSSPANNQEENESAKQTYVEFKILAKNYAYSSTENVNINIDVYNEHLTLILENVELTSVKNSEESEPKLLNLDYQMHTIRVNKTFASKIVSLLDSKFLIYPHGIKPTTKKMVQKLKSRPIARDPYQKKWEIL